MNKVYLVVGATGEYTSHVEWNVAAYRDEDVAKLHTELLNQWLKEYKFHVEYYDSNQLLYGEFVKGSNPYDPKCIVRYTGTKYSYAEVPLFLHPDELIEAMERGEFKRDV